MLISWDMLHTFMMIFSQWCSESNTNDPARNWEDIHSSRKDVGLAPPRTEGIKHPPPTTRREFATLCWERVWGIFHHPHSAGSISKHREMLPASQKIKQKRMAPPLLGLWVNSVFNWEKQHFEQHGGDSSRDETRAGSEIGSTLFSIRYLMSQ